MIYDIAVIGAGASGLMFASQVKNKSICLIDSNDKIGAKIKVSGGAKCNITNAMVKAKNYLGDQEFIAQILHRFENQQLLTFLHKHGVHPKINEKIVKGTYFCKASSDVIELFSRLISHADLKLQTKVESVKFDDYYTLETNKGIIKTRHLVVASGGLSFPSLGASSIAFDIAKQFGHTVNTLNPALVGFTVQKEQFWFKNLSGLSLMASVKVENRHFDGAMLFAHKGCSGPLILNASLYWKKGKLSLDFLPHNSLEKFMKSNKHISTALPLPKRFISEFLNSVALKDKTISALNKEEKDKLNLLKNYEFAPAGNFGYSKAEVTKGGIETSELDVQTMMSKKQKNLYFLGECLDVTGELGGYNFQFAFSSAVTCAQSF